MSENLHDRIISMIPSADLKAAISATGFRLSDEGMLVTAFRYSPDFDSRINVLLELEQYFSGELKTYASRLIDMQHRMLGGFVAESDDTIYELHIKLTPDSYDETYLCSTYGAVQRIIPLYFKECGCEPIASTRCTIVKRRVFSSGREDIFDNELGTMELLPDLTILSVKLHEYEHYAEKCDGRCYGCDCSCVSCFELQFPCFTEHGDAVSFSKGNKQRYGIVYRFCASPDSDCYIVPLDSDAVLQHDFKHIFAEHEHVPLPVVETISVDDLPENMRENYMVCKKYFEAHRKEKYKENHQEIINDTV